ncbi:MAG: NAD-dependent epimerase/dehydratase family protein [Bacteroidetes bacterium]|nr:NAD-dependent epimerase/dehydratase family protein [Bacteroidota bacterium]
MVFVTGGTGLLGTHLLFDLLSRGYSVRALRRKTSKLDLVKKVFAYYSDDPETLFQKIEWVEGDLCDLFSLLDALDGLDTIYHCAARVSFASGDENAMMRINIDGTTNLVNAAIEKQVKQFCHVSSIATLGRAEVNEVINEETYWKTSRWNSSYSVSKYGAEREVWRGMEEGLTAVIVNPAVILGPGFWKDGNSLLFPLVHNGLAFYPTGTNGYVEVRDVSRAMIDLIGKKIFGERFILSADNWSYKQLFDTIADGFGKKGPALLVTNRMGAIAWRIEKVRSLITRKDPLITRELVRTAGQHFRYSSDKIIKTLDFRFTPLEESIRQICQQYLNDLRDQ